MQPDFMATVIGDSFWHVWPNAAPGHNGEYDATNPAYPNNDYTVSLAPFIPQTPIIPGLALAWFPGDSGVAPSETESSLVVDLDLSGMTAYTIVFVGGLVTVDHTRLSRLLSAG